MQFFRAAASILTLIASVLAEQTTKQENHESNGTSNMSGRSTDLSTDLPTTTTDVSVPTTEEDWSPFPTGDILNNAFLRKAKFCHVLCYSETKLEGLRNFWPYIHPLTSKYDGQMAYTMVMLNEAKEIAMDPILRAQLYCRLLLYPHWGEYSVHCMPGNSTSFLNKWKDSPIGMLRDNIPLSVFNAVLAFFSLILGIFGNILIVVSVLVKKELKSSTNLILVGMAVADCLNSITIVFHGYLDTFLWTITNDILKHTGCAAVNTLKEFSQFAAVNHLVTLSFERYFTICWPMKTILKFTPKKTVLIIIANWLIAGVQAVGYLVLKFSFNPILATRPEYICNSTSLHPAWIYVIYNLAVYLVLPIPILCFNYICTVRSLLTSVKRSREMTGDSSAQTNAEKARLKLTYMMIALVVIYIITVTPGRILDAYMRFDIGSSRKFGFIYGKKVLGAIDMVRGMNSWTNVVVYAIISRQFRAAFKEVLCHCCRKTSGANSGSGNTNDVEEFQAGTMEK